MKPVHRKSAPDVVKGQVQKKNNWDSSEDYYKAPRPREVVIDRKRPGPRYRHILTRQDIQAFLPLLPDWDRLAVGLNAIVLAPGDAGCFGYHVPGVIHVCAWEHSTWQVYSAWLYNRDQALLARLGVECEPLRDYVESQVAGGIPAGEAWSAFTWKGQEGMLCKFTEDQVRAFQLLDVFLHELGHHHDRMTTKSQRRASRGEPYAEEYARRYEEQIWERYLQTFALY
jgi:hypothetical protein